MGKINIRYGDFKDKNHYQLWFFKSKSIKNQLIFEIIFKITLILWICIVYNNFIWVISEFLCQIWMFYKGI